MNILLTILIGVVLLAIGIIGMAVQILFKKDHKFPNTHIGGNPNMLTHGITCAQTWDKVEQKKVRKIKVDALNLKGN